MKKLTKIWFAPKSYTANFVIDLSKVDVSDITVDGVIYHSQGYPSSFINIRKENGKIYTKAETSSSEIFDVHKLKRQYISHSQKLWRNCVKANDCKV